MAKPKTLRVVHGRPGSYTLHEQEKRTDYAKAGETIQVHIVVMRYAATELAKRTVSSGYDIVKKAGLFRVVFKKPVRGNDFVHVIQETAKILPSTSMSTKPGGHIKIGTLSMLAETTKMGCYSFNLPAGPKHQGGTCPAASLGFPFLTAEEQRKAQAGMREPRPIFAPNYICGGCVVGETRVLVRDRGLVPVVDLEQEVSDFEVWSGKAWRRSRAVFTGHKSVYALTTSWGAVLQLTADHKVLTQDRGWVEVQDLDEGERLVFEPPSAHFIKNATIDFVDDSRHHNAKISSYPSAWSLEVGAVLGYLLGDGCVTSGRYPAISVVFCEQDRDAAEKLKNIVGSWVETNTRLRPFEEFHDQDSFVGPLSSRQFGLHWRVQSLAKFFKHLGFDKSLGSESLRAPAGIWQAGTEAVRGFLSGLFGADGSVGRSGKKIEISLSSTSLGLLRDSQQLLFSFFGVRSTMSTYSSNEKRGYKPLFKLCINSDYHVRRFALDVGFFTPRKQQALLLACADLPETLTPNRYPVVKSVEKVSDLVVPVYDLQVDVDHAFVANNITIHNCYALKNSYGNPSQVISQALRLELTERWLKDGSFVPKMVAFIQSGREKSVARRARQPQSKWWAIPNPNFFRIHDSGDMFSPKYTEAWFAICRALPDMFFWAPSRMWALAKGSGDTFAQGVPLNLALRPSALQFGEPAPRVTSPGTSRAVVAGTRMPGISAGSGSGNKVPKSAWECPAYEHVSKGGGAVFKIVEGQETKETAGGTCARAHGPNSPLRGGNDAEDLPERSGCRACWRNKNLSIFYHEH